MGKPHKTRSQWLIEFNIKHKNKYDYSLIPRTVYSRDKVTIGCPKHGDFVQSIGGHLRSDGCLACKHDTWRKSPEERRVIKRAYDASDKRKRQRRAYYDANKEKLIKYAVTRNSVRYHKLKNTPKMAAEIACRSQLRRTLDYVKYNKTARTEELIGYTFEQFREHIELQFEHWMTWENHGEWHVDHIKPLSLYIAEGVTDPKIINALDNLQPLRAKDNLLKGDSY